MALILSLLVLFFIRACGGCVVIGLIVLKYVVLVVFGVVAFEGAKNNINIDINDPSLLYAIAYICWGIAVLSFLILMCKWRQVKIAINIIKAAAEFTREEPQAILVPVIIFIFIVFNSLSIGIILCLLDYCLNIPNEFGNSRQMQFFSLFLHRLELECAERIDLVLYWTLLVIYLVISFRTS